ncbi:hypothetical protein KM043_004036 [Ampulex compressa]|nr:hypothetical protein KM043_004036 [Ampulex compressa]
MKRGPSLFSVLSTPPPMLCRRPIFLTPMPDTEVFNLGGVATRSSRGSMAREGQVRDYETSLMDKYTAVVRRASVHLSLARPIDRVLPRCPPESGNVPSD